MTGCQLQCMLNNKELCICTNMCECMHTAGTGLLEECTHTMACMWKSEDNLGCQSSLSICLRQGQWLFTDEYARPAGPKASGENPVSAPISS